MSLAQPFSVECPPECPPRPGRRRGLASAITSGVLYYGLAYCLYLSGLRHVPASFAAVSFYLIPVFGVAGAFHLLGERLDPSQWLGVAIVLAAIFVLLWRTSATAPERTEQSVGAQA